MVKLPVSAARVSDVTALFNNIDINYGRLSGSKLIKGGHSRLALRLLFSWIALSRWAEALVIDSIDLDDQLPARYNVKVDREQHDSIKELLKRILGEFELAEEVNYCSVEAGGISLAGQQLSKIQLDMEKNAERLYRTSWRLIKRRGGGGYGLLPRYDCWPLVDPTIATKLADDLSALVETLVSALPAIQTSLKDLARKDVSLFQGFTAKEQVYIDQHMAMADSRLAEAISEADKPIGGSTNRQGFTIAQQVGSATQSFSFSGPMSMLSIISNGNTGFQVNVGGRRVFWS